MKSVAKIQNKLFFDLTFKNFHKERHIRRIGVHAGSDVLTYDDFEVLPLFLDRLYLGEIF
jgi:hypothetical protein